LEASLECVQPKVSVLEVNLEAAREPLIFRMISTLHSTKPRSCSRLSKCFGWCKYSRRLEASLECVQPKVNVLEVNLEAAREPWSFQILATLHSTKVRSCKCLSKCFGSDKYSLRWASSLERVQAKVNVLEVNPRPDHSRWNWGVNESSHKTIARRCTRSINRLCLVYVSPVHNHDLQASIPMNGISFVDSST
jgi:hypothetical protein